MGKIRPPNLLNDKFLEYKKMQFYIKNKKKKYLDAIYLIKPVRKKEKIFILPKREEKPENCERKTIKMRIFNDFFF